MLDWLRRLLRIEQLSQTPKSEPVSKELIAIIIKPYEDHIASLRAEIERQQHLIQVLSDDKFFKPQVIPAPEPLLETKNIFKGSDFEFSTPADEPPVDETITDEELDAELTTLQQQYAEVKAGK